MLYAFLLMGGMWLGIQFAKQEGHTSWKEGKHTNLESLIQLINEKYVDSVDHALLYKSGIEGIMRHLDPHTVYIPAKELNRVNEELEGSFYGIGIEFYILHDTLCISGILPGGPSEHKNMIPGDRMITIDEDTIAGKGLDEEKMISRIRGGHKTRVRLGLLRFDGSRPVVALERDQVPIKSVSASFKLDHETGFIKINVFSETTYEEFKQALEQLKAQGISKLVIDVRENPGGYMDAVAHVADELISGTHVIVSTRGRKRADSLVTSEPGLFENGKVCILVDENSASASEILAGAIQDLDRGSIIGRRTYGKGLVQEQFELPDHAAIRITTARYYLPSGRCIQRSYAHGKEEYRHDLIDRFSSGELQHGDSSHSDKPVFYTIKKRKVFGNEGVTPDYFIPLDTTYHPSLDAFYIEHAAEQIVHRFAFFHPKEMTRWKTPEEFTAGFKLTPLLLNDIRQFMIAHHIDVRLLNERIYAREITDAIRIQFARFLFGNTGRYQESYRNDPFIMKALNVMAQ